MENLTADNWKELFARFPGLEGAMLSMAHKNELGALERGHAAARLNDWELRRLEELRALLRPATEKLTHRELVKEFRFLRTGDAWGETMGAFFDLAEYVHFRRGAACPAAWQYSPGAAADVDAQNYWLELFDETETPELVQFGNILERHARRVRAAGLDY